MNNLSIVSWIQYIVKLCSKPAQKIGILKRNQISSFSLVALYHTIIQPNIDYCLTEWGYVPDVYVDMFQRTQNRAARVVSGIYYDYDIVSQLGWQTT